MGLINVTCNMVVLIRNTKKILVSDIYQIYNNTPILYVLYDIAACGKGLFFFYKQENLFRVTTDMLRTFSGSNSSITQKLCFKNIIYDGNPS